jgi:molecular chaperone DnaK
MAKDKATSKEQSIRITSSSGLTKEEVERMKKEAAAHSSEDKKKKEEIELRNQADNIVFQTEKQLKEFGEKISPDLRSRIEGEKDKVRDAIKGGDGAAIKSAMDSLNSAWNEASSQMYQHATAEQGGAQQASPEQGKPGEKKVEDAHYEVVDEKEKK